MKAIDEYEGVYPPVIGFKGAKVVEVTEDSEGTKALVAVTLTKTPEEEWVDRLRQLLPSKVFADAKGDTLIFSIEARDDQIAGLVDKIRSAIPQADSEHQKHLEDERAKKATLEQRARKLDATLQERLKRGK